MEFMLVWIVPIIGGLIWYIITSAAVKAPGSVLQSRFVSLGTLAGKSYSEITAKVGNPNSISNTVGADGKIVKIRQWTATGYHIVLLFDENDICLGISNEIKV